MSEGSVTHWIRQLEQGDEQAAEQLWGRYFEQLVHLCRKQLGHHPRRSENEEDVAVSVFDRAFRGIRDGRFPQIQDRDNLWHFLVCVAAGKAIDRRRRHFSTKGGGRCTLSESGLETANTEDAEAGIGQIVGAEPTPEFATMVAEELQRRLDSLSDPALRQIALLKFEGYTNQEVAEKLACALRTVERRLHEIRLQWKDA